MPPVHNTDIAGERWSEAEWQNYELWEKVEVRLRRRKWMMIGLTALVFLMLSSIPIIVDRAPKWNALAITRKLSQAITSLKREAAVRKQPLRVRFIPGTLDYVMERASRCTDTAWTQVGEGSIATRASQADGAEGFVLMNGDQGRAFDIPGLVQSYCYDPLLGSDTAQKSGELVGFAVVSVKDLADARQDRVSLLLVRGTSGEMSFE